MDQITKYGILWENWRPESFIGKGNFGTVYLARNTKDTSKTCAVKMIPVKNRDLGILPDETIDEELLQEKMRSAACKEIREISLMEQLRSCQNIVTIHNYSLIPGIHDLTILLQMDYLTPLGEWMKKSLPSRDEIIRLGIDLCHALSDCEKHQIIHRDIKPDNIFIDASGTYQLGDFGLSRTLELSASLTASLQSRKGTPLYIAPECWDLDKTASYRSDQYSLGIVLYQLLNHGRTPFCDDMNNVEAIRNSITRRLKGEELPAPDSENGELWQIIKKACEFEEAKRYSSAFQMKNALQELSGRSSSIQKTGETQLNRKKTAPCL